MYCLYHNRPLHMSKLRIYGEQNDIDLENKIAAVRHENAKIFYSVTIHSVTVSIVTEETV